MVVARKEIADWHTEKLAQEDQLFGGHAGGCLLVGVEPFPGDANRGSQVIFG